MNWQRITDWAQASECGHYIVSAAKVMGVFRFEAWYRHGGNDQNLGIFDEAAQARLACEVHARKVTA